MASADSDQILPTISEQPPSLLVYLLEEIWRIILKKLTQQEALNLRLVDSDFKTKVDTLYEDWSIEELDEDSSHFDWMLDLRAKEVSVERLMNPIPNRPLGIIFKYPDLITKITINVNTISGENLSVLLQYKTLKNITIRFASISMDEFWPTVDPQISFNFPELHTLDIMLPNDPKLKPIENSCYEKFMTQSVMPKLSSLEVDWDLYHRFVDEDYIYECSSTLLKFMGQHGQSLKHFTYYHLLDPKHTYDGPSLLDQKALFTNCSTLETLKIEDTSDALQHSWNELIRIQSKLIEINLNSYSFCSGFSSSLCAEIAANNYETLTKLVIIRVAVDEGETSFDMSIFSKCVNLRYLKLISLLRGIVELCNLHTLPKQIETIELEEFFITSENLSSLFNCFYSLSNISILRAGESGQFGVNFSVLESILKHSSLKYIYLSSGSINVPRSRFELARMNEIYFRRVSVNVRNHFNARYPCLTLKKSTDSNGTPMWIVPS